MTSRASDPTVRVKLPPPVGHPVTLATFTVAESTAFTPLAVVDLPRSAKVTVLDPLVVTAPYPTNPNWSFVGWEGNWRRLKFRSGGSFTPRRFPPRNENRRFTRLM